MPLPGTALAGSQPEKVAPAIDKLLGKLALGGRLTGSWAPQAAQRSR
jgi:hypothetical protein